MLFLIYENGLIPNQNVMLTVIELQCREGQALSIYDARNVLYYIHRDYRHWNLTGYLYL